MSTTVDGGNPAVGVIQTLQFIGYLSPLNSCASSICDFHHRGIQIICSDCFQDTF